MNLFDQFKKVECFVFDVDGVLTDGHILVTEDGMQLRSFDIKDGYALRCLVDLKIPLIIISGGNSQGVAKRLHYLGIEEVHLAVKNKVELLTTLLEKHQIKPENCLFMGDDIPDLNCMKMIGFPTCPADAVQEIKTLSTYISPLKGGKGAVRDVIEKTLKLQGKWPAQINSANG